MNTHTTFINKGEHAYYDKVLQITGSKSLDQIHFSFFGQTLEKKIWDHNVDDYKDIVDKIIDHINNKPLIIKCLG